MTGSIAARRCIGFLMAGDTPRFWPWVKTREPVAAGGVVASISGIGQNLFDLIADRRLHAGDHILEGVTIVRGAGKGHGMDGELAAL